MGRGMNALRYAALEGEMSAGPGALDETCDADFEAVVAEFGRMTTDDDTKTIAQRATRARDGSKTAAKLEARMRRRAPRTGRGLGAGGGATSRADGQSRITSGAQSHAPMVCSWSRA